MKWQLFIASAALCYSSSGCFWKYAAINSVVPVWSNFEECQERLYHRKMAQLLLEEGRKGCGENKASKDYDKGFIRGFVDYLDADGNGEPPVAPPYHYRARCYETPEGHQAIQDWYAGFRDGTAMAIQSGIRRWTQVPLAIPPKDKRDRYAPYEDDSPNPAAPESALPTPRSLPTDSQREDATSPPISNKASLGSERPTTIPHN